MSTYKVIQDIEAEDKLVGPLTLRQFIYAGISALMLYLSFIAATKHVGFLIILFAPVALLSGFLAAPWGGDQPTEVWAIAKFRFYLKPRRRIWDQSGAKNLVTITVPKKIERTLTNGLSQTEVNSRLRALADTLDSGGWAVKNINVNMSANIVQGLPGSDRLVDASVLPQEVSGVDIRASDDILDAMANPIAQHFDTMMADAAATQRQHLVAQLQQPAAAPVQPVRSQPAPATAAPVRTTPTPAAPPNDYWFMQQPTPIAGQATFQSAVVAPGTSTTDEPPQAPQAAAPTDEEKALVEQLKEANNQQSIADEHLKHVKTPEQIAAERQAAAEKERLARSEAEKARKAQVTSDKRAAIMNLANNDDLNVATLARQAHIADQNDEEVVISLH